MVKHLAHDDDMGKNYMKAFHHGWNAAVVGNSIEDNPYMGMMDKTLEEKWNAGFEAASMRWPA